MKKTNLSLAILLVFLDLFFLHNALADTMSQRLKGKILLQTEKNGEAWYVYPIDGKKYYLGKPDDAFKIMKQLSLGVSNRDFATIRNKVPQRLAGQILLKTEDGGKAYYIDTRQEALHYLGRPSDAFNIMKSQGLGIEDKDLAMVQTGHLSEPNTSDASNSPSIGSAKELSLLEKREFDLINDYRTKQGLPKLIWNDTIASVARQHSKDMAEKVTPFGHDGFSSRVDYLNSRIHVNAAAENVAYNFGFPDPANEAYDGWLNSPPHHKAIVSKYKLSGMGAAKTANGTYYFTQIFVL